MAVHIINDYIDELDCKNFPINEQWKQGDIVIGDFCQEYVVKLDYVFEELYLDKPPVFTLDEFVLSGFQHPCVVWQESYAVFVVENQSKTALVVPNIDNNTSLIIDKYTKEILGQIDKLVYNPLY